MRVRGFQPFSVELWGLTSCHSAFEFKGASFGRRQARTVEPDRNCGLGASFGLPGFKPLRGCQSSEGVGGHLQRQPERESARERERGRERERETESERERARDRETERERQRERETERERERMHICMYVQVHIYKDITIRVCVYVHIYIGT